MVLRDLFQRLIGGAATGARTTGPPPSANGASSFHLFWDAPPTPFVEAEATIEVIDRPSTPSLYFWALQVDLERDGRRIGGAHFGLQHHPAYPGDGAVNWGGYADAGGELEGSVSALPSTLDNRNTRDYRWEPGRRYRYRIAPSPEQPEAGGPGRGWRGSITDLETGVETVVRDLWVDADRLSRPMVWSEVFADCDGPSAAIRWTDLAITTADGERITVDGVRLNYQTNGDGGCANTDSSVDPDPERPGFVQRTTITRVNRSGDRLRLR